MKNIIYTAKIQDQYFGGDFIKIYVINRFFDDKSVLIDITNHILKDDTIIYNKKDFFAQIKNTESNYDKFLKNTWFDINLYCSNNADNLNKEIISYKEFVHNNLNTILWNLLFTEGTEQLRYAIQFCNHDNLNIKLIACDILRNQSIIEFKNKKMLQLIIQGKIDLIEELIA